MEQLILSLLIICFAFFGESIFGFGGGLISIPLLSIFLGVKDAVTLVLIFQLLMGVLIIKTHKDTDWKIAIPMTVGLIIGTVVGTYMLSLVNDAFLRKFLAVSIFLFLIKLIFFKGFVLGKNTLWGLVAGSIGGWFQGMIGTGGPIFTMYLSVATPAKSMFRATLIYLFFATSVIRLSVSLFNGLISKKILFLALPTIPLFLLAVFLGHLVHKKIEEKYYRYAVNVILLFSAVLMMLK